MLPGRRQGGTQCTRLPSPMRSGAAQDSAVSCPPRASPQGRRLASPFRNTDDGTAPSTQSGPCAHRRSRRRPSGLRPLPALRHPACGPWPCYDTLLELPCPLHGSAAGGRPALVRNAQGGPRRRDRRQGCPPPLSRNDRRQLQRAAVPLRAPRGRRARWASGQGPVRTRKPPGPAAQRRFLQGGRAQEALRRVGETATG